MGKYQGKNQSSLDNKALSLALSIKTSFMLILMRIANIKTEILMIPNANI